jgi:hypothetical protein
MKPIVAGLILMALGTGAYVSLKSAHRRAASPESTDGLPNQGSTEATRGREAGEYHPVSSSSELPTTLARTIRDLQASTDPQANVWGGVLLVGWSDFGRGVAAIRRHYGAVEADSRISQLFHAIHEHTLEDFGAHLNLIPDERERASAAKTMAYHWAERDPARVELLAAHLTGTLKESVIGEVVRALSESDDFARAAHLTNNLPSSKMKSEMLQELATSWAREQPAIALQWSQSLRSAEDRRAAESGILGASGLTREELVAFANASTDPASSAQAMNAVADRMVAADVQQAMQWVSQVPAQFRADIQEKIAVKLAESDTARGTAYALAIEDPEARNSSLDAINSELVSQNPDTAVQWLEALPPDDQERAAFNTVSLWYDLDATQVSRWISTLDAGNLKDQALLALSSRLAPTNPDAARSAASQITDPELRTAALDDL